MKTERTTDIVTTIIAIGVAPIMIPAMIVIAIAKALYIKWCYRGCGLQIELPKCNGADDCMCLDCVEERAEVQRYQDWCWMTDDEYAKYYGSEPPAW